MSTALLVIIAVCNWTVSNAAAQNLPSAIPGAGQDQETLESLPTPMVQQQSIPMIDTSLSGWNEAGPGVPQIGTDVRSNWIMLDSGGSVLGSVSGASGSDVAGMKIFVLRDGVVVNQSTASDGGSFKLDGLSAGLYTIVGYSPSAIFAFGFNAVNYRDSCPNMPRQVTTRAIASIGNKMVVSDLISKHAPEVRFPLLGQYAIGEADISEANHFGWQGLGQFDVPATPATTIASQTIALTDGGKFSGRVHQIHNRNGRPIPILQTKMLLIESGMVVDSAGCDRFGIFKFSAIPPGDYGLVAVGSDGFSALGIQLVGSGSASQTGQVPQTQPESIASRRQSIALVSHATSQPSTPPLDLTLIQDEAIGWLNHYVTEQQFKENISQPRRVARQNYGPGFGTPHHCGTCNRVCYGTTPDCNCDR